MIIAKNDEEMRSKIWRIVTTIATVVIIVVFSYFLFTLFAGNPLEGTWAAKESRMKLTLHKGGSATAYWPEIGEMQNVKLNLKCTISKESKTISFQIEEKAIEKAVKASDGKLTREAILTEAGVLENTFDYNRNQNHLTLAEREYGEKMAFEKE